MNQPSEQDPDFAIPRQPEDPAQYIKLLVAEVARLTSQVVEQGKVIDSFKTEAGRTAFALSIGWPLPEEVVALRQRVEELEREPKAHDVLCTRCLEHAHVPPLNPNGPNFQECGACIHARLRAALEDISRLHLYGTEGCDKNKHCGCAGCFARAVLAPEVKP